MCDICGVAGHESWERLSERARAFLAAEGGGARVDAALTGLDPEGLGRIGAPVMLFTGDTIDTFYGYIADALAGRIADGRRGTLPGMSHAGPITDPIRFAEAVVRALTGAGVSPAHPRAVAADRPRLVDREPRP